LEWDDLPVQHLNEDPEWSDLTSMADKSASFRRLSTAVSSAPMRGMMLTTKDVKLETLSTNILRSSSCGLPFMRVISFEG
jgi:hypothetical protein